MIGEGRPVERLAMPQPAEQYAMLKRWPFEPFRICMSDGSTYEIRHPELVFVTRSDVLVGIGCQNGGLPHESAFLDPIHVTRIIPIRDRKRGQAKGRFRPRR